MDSGFWEKKPDKYDTLVGLMNTDLPDLLTDISNQIPVGSRVCEIGCGTALFTFSAASRARKVLAIDNSQRMVEVTTRRLKKQDVKNVRVFRHEAENLAALGGDFDVILIANTLQVLKDPVEILRIASAKLAPRGVIIAPTFIYKSGCLSLMGRCLLFVLHFPVERAFSKKSYREIFRQAELEIQEERSYEGIIPISVVVARSRQLMQSNSPN